MKQCALVWPAKRYVTSHTSLQRGSLTLGEEQPGLVEFTFMVWSMKQVVLDLLEAEHPVWTKHWFEHTPHWIAYHFEIDALRKIVVRHNFGGLRARIQLIDNTEH